MLSHSIRIAYEQSNATTLFTDSMLLLLMVLLMLILFIVVVVVASAAVAFAFLASVLSPNAYIVFNFLLVIFIDNHLLIEKE